MIWSTLIMIVLTLLAYIWAWWKVKRGSGIKDVQKIALIMIICMICTFIVMADGMFLVHCPSYYIGFT